MRKQTVFITLALGCVLLSFQNCSGGMQAAEPSFQNLVNNEKWTQKEPDLSDLMKSDVLEGGAQKASTQSCLASDLKFNWPLGGRPYVDSITVNYVDLDDSTNALLDYKGAVNINAYTYDGHKGLDIAIPNWRLRDSGFPVYAAAAGVVTHVVENLPDRDLDCKSTDWNVVIIKHGNGFKSAYGHLKQNSVPVTVGQRVNAGQVIGHVGSSGCSTHPHLHFEVANCNGKKVDPMKSAMFTNAPLYTGQAPMSVMDVVLKQPNITQIAEMIDPGANAPSLKADVNFSLGFNLAAAKLEGVTRIDFYEPSGAKSALYIEYRPNVRYALSHWWWNIYLHQTGTWKAEIKINGVTQREQLLKIVP